MTKLVLNYVKLTILVFFLSSFGNASARKWTDKQAMVKAMEWQEQHPIMSNAPTDWTNGAYYIGVTKACQATEDPKYLAAILAFGYQNQWKPSKATYNADDIPISYSYIFAYTKRKNLVDLEPTKKWLDAHFNEPHEWKTGKHRIFKTLWWWCDALFMAPPVAAYYAKVSGDKTYIDNMHKYFMQTYDLLYDKEEKLFSRDVQYLRTGGPKDIIEKNGEKVFWSRGNGWVLGGLALILESMPKDYEHYPFYVELYKTMAQRIKEIQPKDGLWRVSLLYPEGFSHGEVSGTGFYTYALAWGINNGLLNTDEYKPAVMKAWKALRKCQHPDGMVGWVQNIGDAPYPASYDSWQNYGTGAFLLAGSEIIKLK
jgi:rhamnogalacturonyl hydrolase YesR